MIRKYFMSGGKNEQEKIYWRSHEVTRIEAISDAVFAFTLSLLVISLEVPKNSEELFEMMHGLVPFAITSFIIFWLWRAQYKFFRRYGLHDDTTIAINAILLLFVLSFAYPLKFLFSFIFLHEYVIVSIDHYYWLVVLYNGGFVVFSLLFTLMYLNAARKKDVCKLTPMEHFTTISHAIYFAVPCFAALLAIVIASFLRKNVQWINACYIVYALIGIAMRIVSSRRDKLYKKKFGSAPVAEAHHGTEG